MAQDSAAESAVPTFVHSLSTRPVELAERDQLLADPGFGRVFTDHMATVRYSADRGWHDARIAPRAEFQLDAATAVLHYAQEIFEGLKAYRQPDGRIALFRPEMNARRLNASAARLAMPQLPEELFLAAIDQAVTIDRDWLPPIDGGALYLRPFMIATEVFLGVKPAADYLFAVLLSATGAYFKGGAKPITLWLETEYTRAAPGGTGAAKCGGNYAASLAAQAQAIERGCDQVLFLDAVEHRWIEELGGMNIFFAFDDGSIATPPLTGTILPGITRDSLLTLAGDLGIAAREESYSAEQMRADAADGKLVEAFACGTAAVIAPIGRIKSTAGDFAIGDGQPGPVSQRLREALVAIQRGTAPDRHGWRKRLAADA